MFCLCICKNTINRITRDKLIGECFSGQLAASQFVWVAGINLDIGFFFFSGPDRPGPPGLTVPCHTCSVLVFVVSLFFFLR